MSTSWFTQNGTHQRNNNYLKVVRFCGFDLVIDLIWVKRKKKIYCPVGHFFGKLGAGQKFGLPQAGKQLQVTYLQQH